MVGTNDTPESLNQHRTPSNTESPFLEACFKRNQGQIPIWIMRQAGRYLPEYLAIREKVSFQELCRSPELIFEVVDQPLRRFNLDAAILFSDILTMLEPMGIQMDFPNGGPIIANPIQHPDDIKRLKELNPENDLPFVLDAIKLIRKKLPHTPLIGFAGSPFTLACYLIEGSGSKTFSIAKSFLHKYPQAGKELIDFVAEMVTKYLRAQIKAGAQTVQVFESWGGILSQDDFHAFCTQPIGKIFRGLKDLGVPRIMFVNNISPYLPQVADIDCEVIGVDYRADLNHVATHLNDHAIQGNLDPAVLFETPKNVAAAASRLIESFPDRERLIFNLGHGILPTTPIESVSALTKTVQGFSV